MSLDGQLQATLRGHHLDRGWALPLGTQSWLVAKNQRTSLEENLGTNDSSVRIRKVKVNLSRWPRREGPTQSGRALNQ